MREPPGPAGQDRAPHPIELDGAQPAVRSPGTSSPNIQAEAAFCAPENRVFVLIAAILASALGFMDGSVIALALPAIRADLGASLAQAQWINNGYLLPLGALILLGGALGDRFGLARVFSLGIGIFVAASMACAAAPGPEVLIAARVVQGLGAALMIPGSLALIARSYPEGERG
ncbi:MAG: MFS transporter, partial [Pseudomonadota bacterium]